MAKKGSKSIETGKVKFIKLQREKELARAKAKKKGRSEVPSTRAHRVEPNMMSGESLSIHLDEPRDQSVQEELDKLKVQVDDISQHQDGQSFSKSDASVLKKYIELKELEVRDFRDQQRQYQTYVRKLSRQLEEVSTRNRELLEELEAAKRKEELLKSNLSELKETNEEELLRVKNEYSERVNSSEDVNYQVHRLEQQKEEWKDKVKEDLRKIRLKERELENKYELLKRDTQALLDSKDKHVLELKKKNDSLELEIEGVEEKLRNTDRVLSSIGAKKQRLIDTFRLAISLLEDIDKIDHVEKSKPKEKAKEVPEPDLVNEAAADGEGDEPVKQEEPAPDASEDELGGFGLSDDLDKLDDK